MIIHNIKMCIYKFTNNLKNAVVAFLFQLYRQGGSNERTQHKIYRKFSEIEFMPDVFIHRHRKRGGGNNLRGGGGATYPLPPPNNPPTFSFNFYVKQEKITNVPS